MRVSLKPPSAARIDSLTLTDDPQYSEQVPGGYTTATVKCRLDLTPRLARDGRLTIRPTHGRPWVGTVDSVQVDNGIATITAVGGQACMDDRVEPAPALYCDTTLSPWQERTYEGRSTKITAQTEVSRLRFVMEDGVALGTKANGMWRMIPRTTASRVTFSWKRPSTSIRIRVLYGTAGDGVSDTGHELAGGSWATAWTQDNGTGSTTGTATVNIAADHDALLIAVDAPSGYTPSADVSVSISSLKVYGVATAQVTPMTNGTIVADVLGKQPSWYLNPTTAYLEADTATCEPFAFDDERTTSLAVLEALMQYTDRDLGVWSRVVDGEDVPCLVYRTRLTTPSYHAYVDGSTVVADYAADSTDDEPTTVRAIYATENGRQQTADATPAVPTWLDSIGHERWMTVDVDTTSATTAADVAQLAADTPSPAKGSVTVRGVIADANGGAVYPSEIEAGRIMRLHDPDRGTVDARIVSVDKTGEVEARCEFDNTPARLDAWLARLERKARRY